MDARFDLVASYWTVAGDARLVMRGGTDYSPVDLRERIETAAAAGFTGVGFHSRDLQHWSDPYPSADVRRILDDNGIGYVELEILREWFASGPARTESDETRRTLLTLAAELPVSHIKIGSSFTPGPWPIDRIGEDFAMLCAQFADVGTRVGLEPVAVAYLRTPAQALEVIDAAGADNGGLILDTWHIVRAGVPYDELRSIPKEKIVSVEIIDGEAEPVVDLATDGCDHRRLCGEGAFRVTEFAAAVLDTGYAGQVGVENLSEQNRRRTVAEQARVNFDAATRELAPLTSVLARNRCA